MTLERELCFPDKFVWGAATASYQIEGASQEAGKGESIWDRFCRVAGKISGGHTGDVSCDHYHRYRDDIQLMAQIGLKAYRFSVAWPRILPEGTGKVNQAGLDFYERLVDGILESGIEPYPTLYHWDLPQALQDRGGWGNRDIVEWFGQYAAVVSDRLGDRIKYWTTLNEPFGAAFAGHLLGEHAPGTKDSAVALKVSHHLLLSHGKAVQVIRQSVNDEAHLGIVLNLNPVHPASETDEDRAAARRFDGYLNRWFLEPLFRGSYPEDMLAWYGDSAPVIELDDLALISTKTDFLGVNYYSRRVVRAEPDEAFLQCYEVHPEESEYTDSGREIHPKGIYEMLKHLHDEYGIPRLYVTENGAVFTDEVSQDGQVHDTKRIEYLHEHIVQVRKAIGDGVPVCGYFVWSLMDNFEWKFGYTYRFGLIYVDYTNRERIIKDSGYWYKRVIEENSW